MELDNKKITNFKFLSNSELRIKLIAFENEYNAIQNKIRDLSQKLSELDKNYTECSKILNQRTRGIYASNI